MFTEVVEGINKCSKCDATKCDTCSGKKDTCVKCANSLYVKPDGTCVSKEDCDKLDGSFSESVSNINKCSKCDAACSTCI